MTADHEYRPLSYHEIHLWALQLQVMLDAGVPLHAALELVSMSESPRLSVASAVLADTIGQGRRLSEAMYMINPTFSPFVINLVSVGEKSGRLVQVFERISERAFRRDKTERSVKGALAYPLFLGGVCAAMAFFMAFFMFPKLLPFLIGLRIELPWPTRALIWGTNHLASFLLVGTVLGVWVGTLLAANSHPQIVRLREWLVFETPIFGKINRDRIYADCLTDLYLLLDTQCDLIGSLKSLNPPWSAQRERTLACVQLIRAGEPVTRSMETSGMLPKRFLAPVSSAEEAGNLANTFRLLGEQLEEAVIMEVERLVQLLEPLIMASMGVVTGFVVLATFLPLYSMAATSL